MVTLLKVYFSNVWAYIVPTLKQLLTDIGFRVVILAADAVEEVGKSTIVGDVERRKAAYDKVVTQLRLEGKVAKDFLINLAIELMVAYAKSKE